MITQIVTSELGRFTVHFNHGHKVSTWSKEPICIDAYSYPENIDEWLPCPCCGLKPKAWEYDNGRQTACGCGNNKYDHFAVFAESIMSVHIRCGGSLAEYDSDLLRKNWNEYCQTMINPCSHGDLRQEGKW
ncbi:MAG: hypothetical protein Tp136SUR676911_59 [Prokaryotic dsDNA virus sp.]|jgi:hypothetical protein|nr:MAG: hypothetical protein Tp136SUR676911_59 [Prokaryotic dsDNA virus sp.]|tara:strand:+ start:37438 stop:37830 length:393 start_codon:yes stop_codon:yes gene_type:complete